MPNTSAFSSATSSVASWSYSSWRILLQSPELPGWPAGGSTSPICCWEMSVCSTHRLLTQTQKWVPVLATQDHEGSCVRNPFFPSWISSFLLLFTGGESKGAGHRSRLTCYQGLSPYHLLLYHKKQKNTNFWTCLSS